MIRITIGGHAASVNGGEWTFEDPADEGMIDVAIQMKYRRDRYHPDIDRAEVDAVIALWGDLVKIISADEPDYTGHPLNAIY